MTFMLQATVTCTFITRTKSGVDADGNDAYTSSSASVGGCLFAPGGSTETLGNQDTVVTQPSLYVPTGTVLPSPIDAVVVPVAGQFEVDGTPQSWPSDAGTGYSIVIKLRQVTG